MTHKNYISHTIKLIFKTYKKLVKYLFYNFFSICKNCKLSKYYQTIIKSTKKDLQKKQAKNIKIFLKKKRQKPKKAPRKISNLL